MAPGWKGEVSRGGGRCGGGRPAWGWPVGCAFPIPQSPGPLLGPPGLVRAGLWATGPPGPEPSGASPPPTPPTPAPATIPSWSCRVKSEAIVARREPKEEVEDVSGYLCTELVYSTINLRARGVGGCGPRGGARGPPHPFCVLSSTLSWWEPLFSLRGPHPPSPGPRTVLRRACYSLGVRN